jgi:hypothetical protein
MNPAFGPICGEVYVMKRKIPKKRYKCSDKAWEHLLVAMNKKQDEVYAPRFALDEVADCHGNRLPPALVVDWGRIRVTVRRKELFSFVQEHGKACGREA